MLIAANFFGGLGKTAGRPERGETVPNDEAGIRPPKGTTGKILRTVVSCCPLSAPAFLLWSLASVAASFLQLFLLERLVDGVAAMAAGGRYRDMYLDQSSWYK